MLRCSVCGIAAWCSQECKIADCTDGKHRVECCKEDESALDDDEEDAHDLDLTVGEWHIIHKLHTSQTVGFVKLHEHLCTGQSARAVKSRFPVALSANAKRMLRLFSLCAQSHLQAAPCVLDCIASVSDTASIAEVSVT